MDILLTSLSALWRVVAVGLLLGVGLPALFALGVRAQTTHRVLVSDGPRILSRPSPAGRAVAVLCFGLTGLAVVAGIVVIVFGKQLFG
jgi:hypothetical protein